MYAWAGRLRPAEPPSPPSSTRVLGSRICIAESQQPSGSPGPGAGLGEAPGMLSASELGLPVLSLASVALRRGGRSPRLGQEVGHWHVGTPWPTSWHSLLCCSVFPINFFSGGLGTGMCVQPVMRWQDTWSLKLSCWQPSSSWQGRAPVCARAGLISSILLNDNDTSSLLKS
jgi:hypothetical protein